MVILRFKIRSKPDKSDELMSALDALEADEPEAVVDDYSRAIKAELADDQAALYPQIEREFLAMTGTGTTGR